MRITAHIPIDLDQIQVDRIFGLKLAELTEDWYISESNHSPGMKVLCHESAPHPHNGDTFREEERLLTDPNMQIIRLAIELEDELIRAGRLKTQQR